MSDYSVLHGVEHLHKLATCTSICFDTETLQLKPESGKLRLLQLGSTARKIVVLIDLFHTDEDGFSEIDRFFSGPERFWLAHNAAFDLGWLAVYGWHPKGQTRDTMLASRLLTNGMPQVKHGLAHVAKRILGVEVDKEQQRSDWSGDLSQEQLDYAAKDVELLCEMDYPIHQQIAQEGLGRAYALECRALPALTAMANTGLPWDRTKLLEVEKDYEKDIENLGREFHLELDEALPEGEKLPRDPDGSFNLRPRTTGSVRLGTKQFAGFNIGSPKQLLEKLTLVLDETPIDQKTQKPSASRTALREYAGAHQVISTYLEWKKAEKRRQMVVSLLKHQDADGFIRASYWQLGAETGRMTCSDPNLQQVPRDEQFRSAVVAPEGWALLDADFSQMELRLAAIVAKDENMMLAFKEGKDLHTATAEALGCERQIAKSANFGLLYGSGAKGLSNYAAGMGVRLSEAEAARIRTAWLTEYSGIAKWHKKLSALSDRTSGMPELRIPVTDMRRYLPGDFNRLTIRANSPVQGAGAAILKCALGTLWQHLEGSEEAKICAAVHDELILLVKKEHVEKWRGLLKNAMESAEAKWLGDVPAIADVNVGETWQETH